MRSYLLLCLALLLPLSAQGGIMQHKAYHTGEPVPSKPMIMREFVEMQHARKVAKVTFADLQGNPKTLAEYQGRLVLLNLWASWCPPCLREMPALAKLRNKLQGSSIQIVPLSIDEDPAAVAPFLAKHELKLDDSWIDSKKEIEKIMPANVVPATYVFDPNGNLVGFIRGYLDWDDPDIADYLLRFAAKYQALAQSKVPQ
ncbi:TlpA family protein disulfide reductase [Shewanella algae]|uniref:TlpA family protein disulfide reductase n=1 Tax=Shewanella algae TaxID=38313 RepID=UPI001F1BD162|nr:TlpA disulfide reductase family protein [Shewanella algae]MCE9777652.1 TlpA family protein disulfide reductase [Shewanella algae]MCE9826939.1 TlpA family protein disulfide reductase [Shewanella algae]